MTLHCDLTNHQRNWNSVKDIDRLEKHSNNLAANFKKHIAIKAKEIVRRFKRIQDLQIY